MLTSHYCSDQSVVVYMGFLISYPPLHSYLLPIFKPCTPLCSSTSTSSAYRTRHFQLSAQPLSALSATAHLLRYPRFHQHTIASNQPPHYPPTIHVDCPESLRPIIIFLSCWCAHYPPISTLVRLFTLHMIYWPETHVKLQFVNKDHIGRTVGWDGYNNVCK
jgi:hypothetical protein